MSSKIEWYFPYNLGGQEEGFENQGINQFKSNPYGKLAREIIQNSYDARKKNSVDKRVKVEFRLAKLPKEKLFDVGYIEECIEESQNYFPQNERLKKFCQVAKEKGRQQYIDVLKISDYNTTGLSGISERENSAWYGLTRSSGNSTKKGTTGGSYGSGKHAPFVFSYFRTVYYSTFVENEGYAFLGKSILCDHKKEGILKCNIGYYGEVENSSCMPIRDLNKVDEFYRRNVTGTDLYIIGAKLESDYWMHNIILSVIENFWKLIIEDKLEIVVGNENQTISINSSNIRRYAQNAKENKMKIDGTEPVEAYKFIEVYDSDVEPVYGSICEENDVKLKILKIPEYGEKKILKMREGEMKINIFSPKKRPVDFIGILEATGEKLNIILRESEPQTHDEWNADNVEDDEYKVKVKRTINALNAWLNEEINKLTYYDDSTEFDAEGLDFLAAEEDNVDGSLDDIQRQFDEIENEVGDEHEITNYASDTHKGKNMFGDFDGNEGKGQNDGTGQRYRGKGKKRTGEGVNNTGSGQTHREIEIPYIKTPYDYKNNIQKLIIRAKEKLENCIINFYKLTDSDDLEALEIDSAMLGNKKLETTNNEIKNVSLDNMNNTVIDIKLKNAKKCIMEVRAYVQD